MSEGAIRAAFFLGLMAGTFLGFALAAVVTFVVGGADEREILYDGMRQGSEETRRALQPAEPRPLGERLDAAIHSCEIGDPRPWSRELVAEILRECRDEITRLKHEIGRRVMAPRSGR